MQVLSMKLTKLFTTQNKCAMQIITARNWDDKDPELIINLESKSPMSHKCNYKYKFGDKIEKIVYDKLLWLKMDDVSCKMYDYFETDTHVYYVFEKLGATLQHLLIENGKKFIDLASVLSIMDQMIVILFKLHSIDFVHNDIKPENILIANDSNRIDKIYLIDFGIATTFWDFSSNEHIKLHENKDQSGSFAGHFIFHQKSPLRRITNIKKG